MDGGADDSGNRRDTDDAGLDDHGDGDDSDDSGGGGDDPGSRGDSGIMVSGGGHHSSKDSQVSSHVSAPIVCPSHIRHGNVGGPDNWDDNVSFQLQ